MTKSKSLKQELEKKLTKKEKEFLVTSFDVIGDIAVIHVPDELIKKEKLIGEAIIKLNKNINVAAREIGIHKGVYRIQKVKVIAGERRKETEHKEAGVRMRLNVEKTYFSPRFGTERLRIASIVKKDEDVLVMFSGIAPFPLVIAKNSEAKKIYGVEINPDAHKYAAENVKLNKMQEKIELFNGDARLIVPCFKKKFDRVAMPLPKGGEDFLDVALGSIKKKGVVHFYDFLHEDEFELARKKVKDACKRAKKKSRILRVVKCGQQSPRVYRICVDFKVY